MGLFIHAAILAATRARLSSSGLDGYGQPFPPMPVRMTTKPQWEWNLGPEYKKAKGDLGFPGSFSARFEGSWRAGVAETGP